MVNARQPGGPPSIGIAEEVYVSVTAYSKEVRTYGESRAVFLFPRWFDRAQLQAVLAAVGSAGHIPRTEDTGFVAVTHLFGVVHAPNVRYV